MIDKAVCVCVCVCVCLHTLVLHMCADTQISARRAANMA